MLAVSPKERETPFFKMGCPEYDIKLHLMVKLIYVDLESVVYPFIAYTPRSTLTRSGSTCLKIIPIR